MHNNEKSRCVLRVEPYLDSTISSILRMALTHSVDRVSADEVTSDGCIIFSFSVSTNAPYSFVSLIVAQYLLDIETEVAFALDVSVLEFSHYVDGRETCVFSQGVRDNF